MDIFTSVCFRLIQFSNWQNISNMSNHSDTLQIPFHSGQHLFSSGRGHLNFPTWKGVSKNSHMIPSNRYWWPMSGSGDSLALSTNQLAAFKSASAGLPSSWKKCEKGIARGGEIRYPNRTGKIIDSKVPAGKGYLLVPRRASPFPTEDTFKQNALIFYADILSWTSTCTGCVLLWRKALSSSSVAMKSRISSTTCDKAASSTSATQNQPTVSQAAEKQADFLVPTPKNLVSKETWPGTPGQCRHQNGSSFDLRKNYRCNKEAGEGSMPCLPQLSFLETFHCSWYKSFENICL